MGFRFRRSIKIAPGIRINFGTRGASVTVGPRGATMTFSSRGTHANVGITGTGISYRTRISGGSAGSTGCSGVAEQRRIVRQKERYDRDVARQEQQLRRAQALSKVSLKLQDDGAFTATGAFGEPLSPADMRLLWEQQGDTLTLWLQEHADEINGDAGLLSSIHLDTPAPDIEPVYTQVPFEESEPPRPPLPTIAPKPVRQELPELGILDRHLKGRVAEHECAVKAIEEEHRRRYRDWLDAEKTRATAYQVQLAQWEADHAQWRAAAAWHEQQEQDLERTFPDRLRTDIDLMDTLLNAALNGLDWPRETTVSYQLDDSGRVVWLDVDLPEIEDLPQRVATLAADGRKLSIKAKLKGQCRQEYALHIHGIALRIAGTVFVTLPGAELAVISGYSQRLNPATGRIDDDYLFSVRFERERFSQIDFEALERVDPIEAVAAFEHRRAMTKTGVFKTIQPFALTTT